MGVKLDEYLDWTYQLDHVSSKLSSANFVLSKFKHLLPISVRKLIYESLVKSHLNYNVLCWGRANDSRVNKIKKIQKKCIRNLANKKYSSHTDPIFNDLGILKFDQGSVYPRQRLSIEERNFQMNFKSRKIRN